MLTIRPSKERGTANFDWLYSRHTFSFGEYYDPDYMGFASLRVINEDQVQPSMGFGTHGHRNMEIITYVLSGGLQHQDSLGTGSVIYPSDVQRMSAGSGIRHSEFNASTSDIVHFLQIWILPNQQEIPPSYEQKTFSPSAKQGKLLLVGSPDGRNGSITIHQDVLLYSSLLGQGETASYDLGAKRAGWLQVARGELLINGHRLMAGDGVAITETPKLEILGQSDTTEFLLFDMAP